MLIKNLRFISTSILLFSIFLFSSNLSSQSSSNSFARALLQEISTYERSNDKKLFNQIIQEYELVKINGEYHVGLMAIVDIASVDKALLKHLRVINDTKVGNLWTMRVPYQNFRALTQVSGIKYIEVGEPVEPELIFATPSARADSVHLGLGELSKAYKGKNVVIAVIDWGFDYTHPTFYDSTLTELRLVRAWDQNKLSGPAPEGFSFGTEYKGKDELLAAEDDTLYVFGPGSHGTHVAGIAGGSGGGSVHVGAAPEAELIFISLRRDAPSFTDALQYVTNYAESVNKPYVVNMSFGSHLGPHDGSYLKNVAINSFHGPGRIFVGSAGNNGVASSRFHLDHDFSITANDTLNTVVNFQNYPDMFGQTLSMWGSAYSSFEASILIVDNNNELVYQTPIYRSIDEPFVNDTIFVGDNNDTLVIRVQSTAAHFLNNKPNIRLEIKKIDNYKVVLQATSDDSHLHIWNNVRMNSRYTNWGVSLTDNYPNAIGGDNHFAVGEPAGVGENVITVASYRSERFLSNGNTVFGNLSSFTSRGPTVDGRTKPDIASTGDGVISSINSFDTSENNSGPTVEFNGKIYGFKPYSGTSMSAPMVSGVVALMLEAYPQLSAVQAKEILKATARLDNNTGEIGHEGHLQWGWGKANALAAVKACEVLSSVKEISIKENLFQLFPNPSKDIVQINISKENEKIREVEIISLEGKSVKRVPGNMSNQMSLSLSGLSSGIYLIKVQTDRVFSIQRLVISE